jgi:hypothetical protein
MTREQMISQLEALYGGLENAVDDLFIGVVADIGYEALSDRGLALLLAWRTEPAEYTLTATYRGAEYRAICNGEDDSFNAAWEAIAAQLPQGQPGDIVDLDDGGPGCGGSLRWHDGGGWHFNPRRSDETS